MNKYIYNIKYFSFLQIFQLISKLIIVIKRNQMNVFQQHLMEFQFLSYKQLLEFLQIFCLFFEKYKNPRGGIFQAGGALR